MRVKETKVYQYSELSDDAKEKARDWYREGDYFDADYVDADYVLEDAATCADLLGIDLRTRAVRLMGGGTRMEPCIDYNGFCTQGDGACFEGTWRASDIEDIRTHAPEDKELARICDALIDIAKEYPEASARMEYTDRYCHSDSMSVESDSGIDLDCEDTEEAHAEAFPEDDLKQLMRDFADWIYKQLETEYYWRNADEQVIESIEANEYEFLEDGSRA